MNREIIFYETASGSCPVEEFLESLTPKQAQKTTWVLRLIEELPAIPSSYLKKLVNTDDILEEELLPEQYFPPAWFLRWAHARSPQSCFSKENSKNSSQGHQNR
ncbi:MAG: hypothetical protein U5J62_04420 [Desulfurivibrio sp.]|nr:hypothetical protein [Desulfurivibrio sp.]